MALAEKVHCDMCTSTIACEESFMQALLQGPHY